MYVCIHVCIGFLLVDSVRLMCKRVTLNAGLHVRLLSAFRSSPARYPINRIVMHRYSSSSKRPVKPDWIGLVKFQF